MNISVQLLIWVYEENSVWDFINPERCFGF